jgi:hypothetical protein
MVDVIFSVAIKIFKVLATNVGCAMTMICAASVKVVRNVV